MKAESYYNKKYFDWQKKIGELGGKINLTKFEKYIKPKDTALDFGCGGGYLLKNLKCCRKIGIEVNKHAREQCRVNGINNVFSDINKVNDNSADVIISNHTLEHTERPIDALIELQRILKKNGKVILALPYNDYRNAKQYNSNDINNHLYTWNIQLIGNCLKIAGFKNIEVKVYTHAWPRYYEILFNKLPRRIFDVICYFTAIKNRQRQIIAIAEKLIK